MHTNRSKYLVAVLFSLSCAFSFSQNYIDILRLSAYTTPPNKFDSSSSKTKINQAAVDFTLPIKLNNKLSILTGFTFETYQAQLFSTGNVESVGSFVLKAGINFKFDSTWQATFMLLPKLASDHIGLGNDDFQMGGLALFKYTKNSNFNWRFGLYYNSERFGLFFVPAAGFYYLSQNKKFEATFLLPISADINYKVATFMNIGMNYIGQTKSYNLDDVYTSTYLQTTTDELYAYLKFNLGNSLCVYTKIGQSIGRSYRVYNNDEMVNADLVGIYFGSKRQKLNTDFANGLIFQALLLYRFNL